MRKGIDAYLRFDETLLAQFRPSPLRYRRAILAGTALVTLAFFLLYPLQTFGLVGLLLFASLVVIGLATLFRSGLLWRANFCLLTNQRLIDIDRTGLFRRQVSECSLDQIIDIRYNTSGIIAATFKLGTVVVDNGNPRGYLEIRDLRHPQEIADQIRRVRHHHSKPLDEAQAI
jgi:hypothetical protein